VFGVDASLRDVGFVNKYVISADEYNFEITFTANFTVLSHTFSAHDKMLQFNVDAERKCSRDYYSTRFV